VRRYDECPGCGLGGGGTPPAARLVDVSTQGKTAYIGCASCGETWTTKALRKAASLPTSTRREIREMAECRAARTGDLNSAGEAP
jgi:hypothetical protein